MHSFILFLILSVIPWVEVHTAGHWKKVNPQFKLRYNFSLEGIRDQNIADNFTEVPFSYMTPAMEFEIKKKIGKIVWLSGQSQWTWQNHVDQREPSLNDPLDRSSIKITVSPLPWIEFQGGPEISRKFYQDFTLAKLQKSLLLNSEFTSADKKFELNQRFDWDDYGEDSKDGVTYGLGVKFRARIGKIQLPRWIRLETGLAYSLESARVQSYFYTYNRHQGGPRLWLALQKKTKINLSYDYASKHYAYYFIHPQTGLSTQKQNQYHEGRISISYEIFNPLKIECGYRREKVQSNQRGYSYSDGEIKIQLSISDQISP